MPKVTTHEGGMTWQDFFNCAKECYQAGHVLQAVLCVVSGMATLFMETHVHGVSPMAPVRELPEEPEEEPEGETRISAEQRRSKGYKQTLEAASLPRPQKAGKPTRNLTKAAREAAGGMLPDTDDREDLSSMSVEQLCDEVVKVGSMQQAGGDWLKRLWPLMQLLLQKLLEKE